FEEALRRELSSADRDAVRADLAAMHTKMGNPDAALRVLEEVDPHKVANEPALLALRVECLDARQQAAAAEELLERGLRDHPGAVELLRVRARRAGNTEQVR